MGLSLVLSLVVGLPYHVGTSCNFEQCEENAMEFHMGLGDGLHHSFIDYYSKKVSTGYVKKHQVKLSERTPWLVWSPE